MPLVNMTDMVNHAYRHNYAVGAFGVHNQDFLEGVIRAAENKRAPLILNLIESHFSTHEFDMFVPSVIAAARQASGPVAVNFDHGTSQASAEHAIAQGCNAVMVDTSALIFSENFTLTRKIVEMAHGCGVSVEGELGYVPGVEGESAEEHPGELTYTSAAEAKAFVERTGVDFLAVSVGTVHGRMKGLPKLDFNRLSKIHEAVDVPLVIHGGTGLNDDQYRRLISNGVAKINYYTGLSYSASRYILKNAAADRKGLYGTLMKGVSNAIQEEAERCFNVWGSSGRAAEVLTQCRPWQEVEHIVLLNPGSEFSEKDTTEILREGKISMMAIPGVRNVRIGQTIQASGKYNFCWLITLSSQVAIENFNNHRSQLNFGRQLFLSATSDWIKQEYIEM